VRGYIEQLIADGLLRREGDPYPILRLTAPGAAVLKGERSCRLYRQVEPVRGKARWRGRAAVSDSGDPELFAVLREVRLRIARERGVPPYVIFHDTTLRDMADRRPRTLDDLHGIYGVGAKKAADFGDAFLDAISTFCRST
jgi:ATP-dependent DNA helicase RecQ